MKRKFALSKAEAKQQLLALTAEMDAETEALNKAPPTIENKERKIVALKRSLALVATLFNVQTRNMHHVIKLANAMSEASDKYISALEPLAKKGAQFQGNKRGLSPLYREALEKLKRDCDKSTKLLLRELEIEGTISRDAAGNVIPKSRKGKKKAISEKQFASNLSRVRKLLH